MEPERIVDADTHINEPPDLWTSRLPASMQEGAPRIVEQSTGVFAWRYASGREATITMLCNAVGTPTTEWRPAAPDCYETKGFRAGAWDPAARLADMDIDRVTAHALFPSYALEGAAAFSHSDRELQLACTRAYNDWMSEFCSVAPERLLGIALLPVTGIDDFCAELERVAGLPGIRGVMLKSWPNGSPKMLAPGVDDRAWSVFEETGLACCIHVGFEVGGEAESTEHDLIKEFHQTGQLLTLINVERQAVSTIPILSNFILSGILERHPALRVGLVEVGVGWVPFFLEQTEDNFDRHRHWTNASLSLRPHEYWSRQCFATFQVDRYAIRNRELVGEHTIMWSSDYPHPGADWPNSRRSIDAQLDGVPADARQRILYDNAARLFRVRTPVDVPVS